MRKIPFTALVKKSNKKKPKTKSVPKKGLSGNKNYLIGEAKYNAAKYAEAVIYFRLALQETGNVSLYKKIAYCYRHLGKKEKAKTYFRMYLNKIPPEKRKIQEQLLSPLLK